MSRPSPYSAAPQAGAEDSGAPIPKGSPLSRFPAPTRVRVPTRLAQPMPSAPYPLGSPTDRGAAAAASAGASTRISPLRRRTLNFILPRRWTFWVTWQLASHFEIDSFGACDTLDRFWNCFGALYVTDMPHTVSQYIITSDLTLQQGTSGQSLNIAIPTVEGGSRMWQRVVVALIAGLLPGSEAMRGMSIHIIGKSAMIRLWVGPEFSTSVLEPLSETIAAAAHQSAVFNYSLYMETEDVTAGYRPIVVDAPLCPRPSQ